MIKTNQNVFFFLIIMLKNVYVEPAIKRNKMILPSNSLILMKLLIGNVYNPT